MPTFKIHTGQPMLIEARDLDTALEIARAAASAAEQSSDPDFDLLGEDATAAPQPVDSFVNKLVYQIDSPGRHAFQHNIGFYGYAHQVVGQDERGRTVFYDALESYNENEIVVNILAGLAVFPVRLVVMW